MSAKLDAHRKAATCLIKKAITVYTLSGTPGPSTNS